MKTNKKNQFQIGETFQFGLKIKNDMKIKQKTEYNIGEVFAFGLKMLQCVSESSVDDGCEGCVFQDLDECPNGFAGPCDNDSRSDDQNVRFVEFKQE